MIGRRSAGSQATDCRHRVKRSRSKLGSYDETPGGQRRYRVDEIDRLWPGFAARLKNVRSAR
jgi:hypothetical protein